MDEFKKDLIELCRKHDCTMAVNFDGKCINIVKLVVRGWILKISHIGPYTGIVEYVQQEKS